MMYRNTVPVTTSQGVEVDAGSLWELKNNNLLVLVDDDQYVTTTLSKQFEPETDI